MPPFLYLFLGALAIVSALGVVVQRNPIHCLLSLISTLMIIAILFIGEDAVVGGFLQIIVYAGAIMVLFLFVIWLLESADGERTDRASCAENFRARWRRRRLQRSSFVSLPHRISG